MHQFPKFTPAWNSTCSGQFLCPSSGVCSLYTRYSYTRISYRFVDSFREGPGWNCIPSWSCSKAVYKLVWHIPVLSVQWINSWWWTEELPGTCRVSCRSKFGKLVHLFGFIIKKFVMLHGHMNVKNNIGYFVPFGRVNELSSDISVPRESNCYVVVVHLTCSNISFSLATLVPLTLNVVKWIISPMRWFLGIWRICLRLVVGNIL